MKKEIKKLAVVGIVLAMLSAGMIVAHAETRVMENGTYFDAEYYARTNQDVVAVYGTSESELFRHYEEFGKNENRQPVELPDKSVFDSEYYAALYPDVAMVYGTNSNSLYQHYLQFGKQEGRLASSTAVAAPKIEVQTSSYYFDASDYGNPYHIRSTNNPDNYLDFSISGSTLTVSGKIVKDGLEKVWVRCGEDGEPIYVTSGQLFSQRFSLSGLRENVPLLVTVYTKTYADSVYWSHSWNDIRISLVNGAYQFVLSPVLEHNLEVMSDVVSPEKGLSDAISPEMTSLSNQIVGAETNDYKKLYLLNYWVADNIYYDEDYYYNRNNDTYYAAGDVATQKRSVCAGYAELLQALIQAQGIPCIRVSTYSTGVSSKGYFDETNYHIVDSNHAHVEAFVDGRWVIMDPTWDSNNKYENGQFVYKKPTIRYFDANLDFFSMTHKLIRR